MVMYERFEKEVREILDREFPGEALKSSSHAVLENVLWQAERIMDDWLNYINVITGGGADNPDNDVPERATIKSVIDKISEAHNVWHWGQPTDWDSGSVKVGKAVGTLNIVIILASAGYAETDVWGVRSVCSDTREKLCFIRDFIENEIVEIMLGLTGEQWRALSQRATD